MRVLQTVARELTDEQKQGEQRLLHVFFFFFAQKRVFLRDWLSNIDLSVHLWEKVNYSEWIRTVRDEGPLYLKDVWWCMEGNSKRPSENEGTRRTADSIEMQTQYRAQMSWMRTAYIYALKILHKYWWTPLYFLFIFTSLSLLSPHFRLFDAKLP